MGTFKDKTGQQFFDLKVLEYIGKSKYKCQCSCGEIIEIRSTELNNDINRYHKINCGGPKHGNKFKNSPENEFYFKKINNEQKAYIVGFIAADGYIQPELNRIKLDVKETDEDVLIKIQESIGHKNNLSHYHQETNFKGIDSSRLVISSKQMIEDLNRIGLVKAKSKILNIDFTLIDSKFIKDFIRGLFDGDGCISISSNNALQINLTTSKEMANKISEWTLEKINAQWTYTHRNENVLETVTLRITKRKEIIAFLNEIYSNSTIYLDRKYKKYKEVLERYNN